MFLSSQSGLGQDRDMINLRRRTRYGILMLIVGGFFALILSLSLLHERRGTLLVSADQPNAFIVLNGSVTNIQAGTPLKHLLPEIYSVSVSLEGYRPHPPIKIVKIQAGKTVETSFMLNPIPHESEIIKPRNNQEKTGPADLRDDARQFSASSPPREDAKTSAEEDLSAFKQSGEPAAEESRDKIRLGTLKVVTHPVGGGIFVDDRFIGVGKVTLTDLNLGEVVVRFGEIEEYRTPEPQKTFLSQSWPYASLEGIYLPLIYIAAYLDQSGRVVAQKCEISQGYILEKSEPREDPVAGPGIKFLDDIGAFAWEIGYAYSNRNPPGEDFIEMIFELPENWDGNKPLELQLYGYASDRKYPFALAGKTAIDVLVNERVVKKDYQPRLKLTDKSAAEFDVIAINSFLKSGKNRIRIQASSTSRCFYYLQEIVLL